MNQFLSAFPRTIVVIAGPTASGKTDTAICLATRVDGEVISADSRQVFRLLDIGTAKPSTEELQKTPHHFIDIRSPDEDFSAGQFGTEGRHKIDDIFSRNRVPIVTGGSGLYIRSLVDGLSEAPGADKSFRREMENVLASQGVATLLKRLTAIDPITAKAVDPTKPRRIIRALEVFHLSGIPLSEIQKNKVDISFTPALFGLLWERRSLYSRIEKRCDFMLQNGLVEELERLREKGYDLDSPSLSTVGYAEGVRYLRGEITYAEFARLFKQNSRRYAKRQMTWFRSDDRIHWIAMDETKTSGEAADEIFRTLKSKPALH